MMKFNLLLIIVIGAASASCDNSLAITPSTKNIVTGIHFTEVGPEAYYIWGNPDFPGPIDIGTEPPSSLHEYHTEFFQMFSPYPIPADGNVYIQFDLPRSANIDIWIETAYWSGENTVGPLNSISERPYQYISLIKDQKLQKGKHSVYAGIKTKCTGGEMEEGFYRVFIRADDKYLLWRDIYLAGENYKKVFGNIEMPFPGFRCTYDQQM